MAAIPSIPSPLSTRLLSNPIVRVPGLSPLFLPGGSLAIPAVSLPSPLSMRLMKPPNPFHYYVPALRCGSFIVSAHKPLENLDPDDALPPPVFFNCRSHFVDDRQEWNRDIFTSRVLGLLDLGVQGIVIEVFWGLVEGKRPLKYDWNGYSSLFNMARQYNLKVKVVLAFHHCHFQPGRFEIPLPRWALEAMEVNGMHFEDTFGYKNREYISFACDDLPLLCGRSPMQVYQDFISSFRENFEELLETTITDIEISTGPDGELRYPISARKMQQTVLFMGVMGLGDIFCHDKHMLKYMLKNVPEFETAVALDGFVSTRFVRKYYDILISHGDKLLQIVSDQFSHTSLKLTARLAPVHYKFPTRKWCEMMAGYGDMREIIQIFKKHKFGVCIPGFDCGQGDLKTETTIMHSMWIRKLIAAAAEFEVPMVGENVLGGYHKPYFEEILKISKVCKDCSKRRLGFNFVADRDFYHSWEKVGFAEFVKTMADIVET